MDFPCDSTRRLLPTPASAIATTATSVLKRRTIPPSGPSLCVLCVLRNFSPSELISEPDGECSRPHHGIRLRKPGVALRRAVVQHGQHGAGVEDIEHVERQLDAVAVRQPELLDDANLQVVD